MLSRIKMALKLLEVIPCDFKGCVGHLWIADKVYTKKITPSLFFKAVRRLIDW